MRNGRSVLRGVIAAIVTAALLPALPAAAETSGIPGDATLTIDVGDDVAGGLHTIEFARVFDGETADKTPVYIYVPAAAVKEGGTLDSTGVLGLDPTMDPVANDGFEPCTDDTAANHQVTRAQVDYLGNQLTSQIVAVDEEHYGPMDAAAGDPNDPANPSDSLVMLVYNVFDDAYYDCAADSYTAGYFAPDFINSSGMNVIVVDSFDWANRTGPENSLYEGVIAHELEHLLMNYSDPGELSWVDEGLADMAAFLNDYDATGSHLTYHQVFHRETSLTRWGGGLENYGASYTYFQYLWDRAGGNGDGNFQPDLTYNDTAGDLLIKRIFEEQADGMIGVNNAIQTYNNETGDNLPSAQQLFQDWAAAVYIDDESTDLFDIKAADFGTADSGNWTISLANQTFYKKRGLYNGATPESRLDKSGRSPVKVALPFSTSYEEFSRRVGDSVSFQFSGVETSQVAPHSVPLHWYGGYESQSENELDITSVVTGGQTLDFWSWYFIEEGWDYGFVEAKVGNDWVTVPVTDQSGSVVSTNTNPNGNNAEGNGLTGTSGGAYFVDEPTYVHLKATLPAGASAARFRYSTDAAYLDTGWFVDDVTVDKNPVTLKSVGDEWTESTGEQYNEWAMQILAPCDLTPTSTAHEQVDGKWHVYQWTGDTLDSGALKTGCLGKKDHFTLVVSNMPSGDLSFLDATYDYRVVRNKG